MSRQTQGFSFSGMLLFCIIIALVIAGLIYGGKELAKTHSIPSLSLAQAKDYCISHDGTSELSPHLYTLCAFKDKTACEIKSYAKGLCMSGVKQLDGQSIQQLLCGQLGGKLLDDATNNCTFSDGSICSSSDVINGTCHQ